MDNSHVLQIVTLILSLSITAVIPWIIRVSNRLTKLETIITNGLATDVRMIKKNCPGCQHDVADVDRRLMRLEEIQLKP